jgi:hypothetical protein
MSTEVGPRQELFHMLCCLMQRYPNLRVCQLICNAVPPEELARRQNDLYYIEDAQLLDYLRSYERGMGPGKSSERPVNPIKRVGLAAVVWCPLCENQVAQDPESRCCPFCGSATIDMGDYTDHVYEKYRNRS